MFVEICWYLLIKISKLPTKRKITFFFPDVNTIQSYRVSLSDLDSSVVLLCATLKREKQKALPKTKSNATEDSQAASHPAPNSAYGSNYCHTPRPLHCATDSESKLFQSMAIIPCGFAKYIAISTRKSNFPRFVLRLRHKEPPFQ